MAVVINIVTSAAAVVAKAVQTHRMVRRLIRNIVPTSLAPSPRLSSVSSIRVAHPFRHIRSKYLNVCARARAPVLPSSHVSRIVTRLADGRYDDPNALNPQVSTDFSHVRTSFERAPASPASRHGFGFGDPRARQGRRGVRAPVDVPRLHRVDHAQELTDRRTPVAAHRAVASQALGVAARARRRASSVRAVSCRKLPTPTDIVTFPPHSSARSMRRALGARRTTRPGARRLDVSRRRASTRRALGDRASLRELYSGIGATRLALERLVDLQDVVAIDNSDAANAVYEANFGDVPRRANIEHLDANALFPSSERDYALTASPPCQPYTRRGLGLASEDPRAKSFHAVIDAIPTLSHPPRWVFVENVRGFESSDTRRALLDALSERDYDVREFIVDPTALGVPNTRERYYLIATRSPGGFSEPTPTWLHGRAIDAAGQFVGEASTSQSTTSTLADYIRTECDNEDELVLGSEMIRKYWRVLDVVTPSSKRCSTFTSGYADTVFGGSVLLRSRGVQRGLDELLELDADSGVSRINERDVEHFIDNLRWFHVDEIKALHGLRDDFTFNACSRKKAIFLLGNSISVHVVREVLLHLFSAG